VEIVTIWVEHHGDLRVVRGKLQVLLVIIGAEEAAGEQQNPSGR